MLKTSRKSTPFAELLKQADLTPAKLAKLTGESRQQIHRYVTGERSPSLRVARLVAPYLRVSWESLLNGETPQQTATTIESGVIIREAEPKVGDRINDLDELALIRMWRDLSLTKKAALFAHMGAEDLPSLRKLSGS